MYRNASVRKKGRKTGQVESKTAHIRRCAREVRQNAELRKTGKADKIRWSGSKRMARVGGIGGLYSW